MSGIIGRLWRLARAELGAAASPTGGGEEQTWAPRGASSRRPPPPESPAGDGIGAQDPRMAGLYSNLEVPYGSDLSAVRASWHRLLKKYHPDLNGADPERRRLANELTAELTRAYRELEQALSVRSGQKD
jgi:hypothetical protein